MIKVFSGKWRGLDGKNDGIGMILSFTFREYMNQFSGSSLQVFLCIALHSDSDGHSYPSYKTIAKETGVGYRTVSSAVNYLCNLTINDHRVLMRYRERNKDGQFVGSNHYLIFPEPDEIEQENENNPECKYCTSPECNICTLDTRVQNLHTKINHKIKNQEKKDKPINTRMNSRVSPTKKPAKTGPELFEIATALAEVTGLIMEKNRPRLFAEAKKYYQTSDIPQILRDYRPGGSWYSNDWRGRDKHQKPTLFSIRETWGNLGNLQDSTIIEQTTEDERAAKVADVKERIRQARNGNGAVKHD